MSLSTVHVVKVEIQKTQNVNNVFFVVVVVVVVVLVCLFQGMMRNFDI